MPIDISHSERQLHKWPNLTLMLSFYQCYRDWFNSQKLEMYNRHQKWKGREGETKAEHHHYFSWTYLARILSTLRTKWVFQDGLHLEGTGGWPRGISMQGKEHGCWHSNMRNQAKDSAENKAKLAQNPEVECMAMQVSGTWLARFWMSMKKQQQCERLAGNGLEDRLYSFIGVFFLVPPYFYE